MEIILASHGYVYDKSDIQVITGKKNDLPLVESGGDQAEILSKMLKEQKVTPINVICSDMRCSKRYAEIIEESIGIPGTPIIDERLNDLDFGDWTGLTDAEVALKYGEKVYTAWVKHGIWPEGCNWGDSPQKIHERINILCNDIVNFYDDNDTVLIVASNNLLKFFLGMIKGEYEKRSVRGNLRMDIGNVAKLVYKDKEWSVAYWNMNPQDILPVPDPKVAAQKAITEAAKSAMMLH